MYTTIIIGYGCSGIALAASLKKGKNLFVEMGKKHTQRRHDDPKEALIGGGGAGFYSDGKFSFFPAGTEIWSVKDTVLRKAYARLEYFFGKYIKDFPEFPEQKEYTLKNISDALKFKQYRCEYLSLEERTQLLDQMCLETKDEVLYGYQVLNIQERLLKNEPEERGQLWEVKIKNLDTQRIDVIVSEYLVIAGGRFAPMYLDIYPIIFKRIEFGARIVSDTVTLEKMQISDGKSWTDPKLLLDAYGCQIRSFCFTKNGEAVLTNNGYALKSYSGRNDVSDDIREKKETNFGFNIRIKDKTRYQERLMSLMTAKAFRLNKEEVSKEKMIEIYGQDLGTLFINCFELFIKELDCLKNENWYIVGPTIEGVGMYPEIDSKTLQLADGRKLFVCGDATGLFRGTIPSILSGLVVAEELNALL